MIWPTLLDNVTSNMRIAWEEPFGPVLPIMRISSPEQAVEHCNKNSVALQVGRFVGGGDKERLGRGQGWVGMGQHSRRSGQEVRGQGGLRRGHGRLWPGSFSEGHSENVQGIRGRTG